MRIEWLDTKYELMIYLAIPPYSNKAVIYLIPNNKLNVVYSKE